MPPCPRSASSNLRFHRFTIGAAWISDYGDPDHPEQFADALAYSPLHNIRPGAHYPATLVLTGDHDDRVVPLHSHKFTATLQHAQAGDAPVLTRIETATGHGWAAPRWGRGGPTVTFALTYRPPNRLHTALPSHDGQWGPHTQIDTLDPM